MFSVLFEVHPKPDRWDGYLNYAKLLRPELVKIDGFIDNIRYRSLTRDGWILSLSTWRDEKALVRWRTLAVHHGVQEKGREEVFLGYHLRVGQITQDSHVPAGYAIKEQRLDETEVGEGTAVVLIEGKAAPGSVPADSPDDAARALGLPVDASQISNWDIYDAVLEPGNLILTLFWKTPAVANAYATRALPAMGRRIRSVRVIRDYSMTDRREAPQYYPEPGSRQ